MEDGADISATRAFIETFADESGHRRAVDRPLLSVLLHAECEPRVATDSPARPSTGVPGGPDVQLWSMLAAPAPWRPPAWLRSSGPLASDRIGDAIEVWTETELACLHAMWSLARRERDPALRERCLDAAAWMLANIQPDNGTNHPWAIHVFAWMWAMRNDSDARLYAESMLHTCMVSLGRPDRFSACVLWHGAAELEAPVD